EIELAKRHFTIEEALPENIVSMEFEHGVVYIDLTMDEKILSLGYAREVVRRIQQMRKELDLDIEAFIKTKVEVKDEKIVELLENQREYISRETRSKLLEISTQAKHEGYVKEWDINNKHFVISIKE
ncbi:MAG: isoleucine--tRNA ligase, partial [Candidatus Hydrothermarchaeota archaeon]